MMFRIYFYFFTQRPVLEVLREQDGVLGIEPGSAISVLMTCCPNSLVPFPQLFKLCHDPTKGLNVGGHEKSGKGKKVLNMQNPKN